LKGEVYTVYQENILLNQNCEGRGGEGGHRCHDRLIVGFIATCEIRAYHH
jgi:hypothetical protein